MPAGDPAPAIEEAPPLRPTENVLGSLDVDLTRQLRFGRGVILITDQRLVTRFPDATGWQARDLHPGLSLAHHDHAIEHGSREAPAYRLLSSVIKAGCRVAIKVSEKAGKRRAWIELAVATADVDRATAWPATLLN